MYFIDVQGTLLNDTDKSLIKGAKELIELLNVRNMPYVVITNNTKDLNFLSNLRTKGLEIKENAYIDPFCVLENSLKSSFYNAPQNSAQNSLKNLPQSASVAAFGSSQFLNALEQLGFKLDFSAPKAVLVASFDDFTFKDFARMIELVQKGARLIAMHETSIYKKNNFSYPGVGAIMKMLEYATSTSYEVIGKPSHAFYKAALALLQRQEPNAKFSDICIISDDYQGDLVGAKALQMKTALVLSGKIKDAKNTDKRILDRIYPSVYEIFKELE